MKKICPKCGKNSYVLAYYETPNMNITGTCYECGYEEDKDGNEIKGRNYNEDKINKIILNIEKYMAQVGIKKTALSIKSGLSKGAVSKILNKNRVPIEKTLRKIATGLGVTIDDLKQDV